VGPKLYNVVRLYVDGIRDGHLAAALDKYVAEDLVQHTPGVADGRDGLAAIFQPLVERHQRRTVVPLRGFEDGSRVFLHSFATFGLRAVELVTIDIFDTDDEDQIVEHWSVSAPLCTPSRSGASPIDGPRIATDLHLTAANKRVVRGFLGGSGPQPMEPARIIEHGHDLVGGTRIDQMIGHGSFVATVGARERHFVADLFRVDGGAVVEHWDAWTPLSSGLG
jgi:predicted SnoaL-like aldol condensation-catalyzing enzyme